MTSSPLFRAFCLLIAISFPVSFVHAADAVDEHGQGPKVGTQIPHDLALPDQNGQRLDYMARARAKGLIILFSRSVGWWPHCKRQAVVWQNNIEKAHALGYEVAFVTYDKPDTVARFAKSSGITYPMLSDAGSKAIAAFGLVSDRGRKGTSWYGFAEPAIIVVDKAGKVTHRFTTSDYTDRPDPAPVLNALR